MRPLKLAVLTFGSTALLSVFATYGFANDKSHKEAWSDPVAMSPVVDGMLPIGGDMAPKPINAKLVGAGPMVAALGNTTGARTLEQDPAAGGAGMPGTSGASEAGAAANESLRQGEKLDDEKILHVAHIANTGEIAQAKLAVTRASDPRVKKFARMMITMHGDAEKKEADVVRRRNLNMVASKTSDNLKSEGDTTCSMLKGKSGAEFDHAYIDAQVKGHEEVLSLIDTKLQPGATDNDVKTLVSAMRPTVQSHLDQAKALQGKLKN